MGISIKAENVSKVYQLGSIGTGTISRDIERWIARMRGKQDPFLKIGQKNIRSSKGDSDIVYSLNNLNFEIEEGSAVGVIGRNGAGKSTLLKILSRVTLPSTGRINVKGRVASLLEVGTGFHPELTGKENIFLNGAILGMRKHEIQRKLDEIIDFSGVERYIDTPVKRYSSGMYVRLAFAVAAHLESEILIVDEVLAVGDAEFQNKCIGKMSDVSKGEGRTILFVSHQMAAIKTLCQKGIILKNGELDFMGEMNQAVDRYLNEGMSNDSNYFSENANHPNAIKSIQMPNDKTFYRHDEEIKIEIELSGDRRNCNLGVAVLNNERMKLFTTVTSLEKNITKIKCTIPANSLIEGDYYIDVATFDESTKYEYLREICRFEILDLDGNNKFLRGSVGSIKIPCKWDY